MAKIAIVAQHILRLGGRGILEIKGQERYVLNPGQLARAKVGFFKRADSVNRAVWIVEWTFFFVMDVIT